MTISTIPALKSVDKILLLDGSVSWKVEMIAVVPLPGPQPISRIVVAEEKGRDSLRSEMRREMGMDMGALEMFAA